MIPHRDRDFRSPPEIGHVQSESPVTLLRNNRSRSIGIVGHVPPETVVILVRNTHFVSSNPGVSALMQATRTIPIVFIGVSDAVGSGFVASLARPGGHITGFHNFEPSIAGKWLEVLKQIAPGV